MEYPYALGCTLLRAGRVEDALGVLDEASDHPAICLRHLIRGQLEEAGHALANVVDRVDLRDLSDAAVELGLDRLSDGDVEAAEGIWQLLTAGGDGEGSSTASAFLAALREDLGDAHGALRSWQQSTDSATEIWRRFGLARASSGEHERGRRALERAVGLGRDSAHEADRRSAADAAHPLGYLAYDANDRPAAVAAFAISAAYEHVDRYDRTMEAGQNLLVLINELNQAGEHEQTVNALHRLVESGHQTTACVRAEEYAKTAEDAGELEAAANYHRAMVEFGDPFTAAGAGMRLGHLLVKLERRQEADEVFASVVDCEIPELARLAEFSRYALVSDTDESAADEILARLVEASLVDAPETVPGAEDSSGTDGDGGDGGDGSVGAQDGPEGAEALAMYLYGRRLEDNGDTERATQMFRRVYDGGSEWAAAAALSLGVQANEVGDTAQACEWWLRAVDDEGDAGENSIQNLGVVHKQEKRYSEAEKWWRRLMDSFPHRRAEAAAHIGEMHWWTGEKQQAIQWYGITLAESQEPELVGEAAYRTGEFLLESGQAETAREILARAVDAGFEPFASSASGLLSTQDDMPGHADTPVEAEPPLPGTAEQPSGTAEQPSGTAELPPPATAEQPPWMAAGTPQDSATWRASQEPDLMELAVTAKRAGDLPKAKQWFEQLMDSDPGRRAECAAQIGEMHYWQGEKRQAAQWYRITLEESTVPELVGEAATRAAEALLESGAYQPARELLVRAVETGVEPYASTASNMLRQSATDIQSLHDASPSDTPPPE